MIGRPINNSIANPLGKKNQKNVLWGIYFLLKKINGQRHKGLCYHVGVNVLIKYYPIKKSVTTLADSSRSGFGFRLPVSQYDKNSNSMVLIHRNRSKYKYHLEPTYDSKYTKISLIKELSNLRVFKERY